MSSSEKLTLSGDSNSKKAKDEASIKLIGKRGVSFGLSIGVKGKDVASSGIRGKAIVSDNEPYHYLLGRLLRSSWTVMLKKPVAWFECTTTIDNVVHGSKWYYIGCGVCHTKEIKGPTTLMSKKCGKSEIFGVAQHLSKISVYDNNDQAVFVLLGDAGQELTGKKASELVEHYTSVGDDHIVPVPQALIDTIGQTRVHCEGIKHNFTGKIQTLTITMVLPLEDPEAEGNLGENVKEEPVDDKEEPADDSLKRSSDGIATGETKRAKCG
ncbi:unnamed protein product [Eruca vesicaria subsp. sativa]|uniref:Replication factor A C-terminal domain-containing protein n=1 Tax=Eruca vesicaria subsp. sativa TaxID=29727 RepID=A0ABC8JLH0_ERUVS|nr:unnamed protein product [Eruca vesicaria subsp. sativa]